MAWWQGTTARLAVATAALGVGLVASSPSPAGAAAPPSVAVSPSTDLLDGHHVDVAATGIPSDAGQILVTQCGPGPAETDCASVQDGGGRPYLPPNVDVRRAGTDGSFATDLLLDRTLRANREVDCVVEACSVRIYRLDQVVGGLDEPLATAPVGFAATGTYQWPPATLALGRTTGLRDGQQVEVTGAGYSRWNGFPPIGSHWAPSEVCRAVAEPDPDADCVQGPSIGEGFDLLPDDAVVGGDGSVSGTVTARRWLDLPSGEWDCAVGGCTLALSQERNPVSNRVPLSFGPEWLPYATANTLIDAVYGQMIGVALRPDQRNALLHGLGSRQVTGAQLIADATVFPGDGSTIPPGRHDQVVADVTRTYVAFFGRRPDTPGLTYWVGRREAGASAGLVARSFGGTPEFRSTYGGLSNAQVVDRAYLRILGRASDPAGRGYWLAQLAAGMTRDRMVHLMSAAPEHRAQQDAHARIEVITFGLAGRAATGVEWDSTPLRVARGVLATG